MSQSWYPFYPGDYARDTADLSCCEHGCYRLLLDAFWTCGPLPDDLDRLTRLTANAPPETVRFILERYWVRIVSDGLHFWINPRLNDIQEKQRISHQKRVNAGRIGGVKKASNAKAKLEQCYSNATHLPPNPATVTKRKRFTPPTVAQIRDYVEEKGYKVDPEYFHAHYQSNGWKVGKNSMKSWKSALVTWEKRNHEDHRGTPAKQHRQTRSQAQGEAIRALAARALDPSDL